jgi:hypothetical protein
MTTFLMGLMIGLIPGICIIAYEELWKKRR